MQSNTITLTKSSTIPGGLSLSTPFYCIWLDSLDSFKPISMSSFIHIRYNQGYFRIVTSKALNTFFRFYSKFRQDNLGTSYYLTQWLKHSRCSMYIAQSALRTMESVLPINDCQWKSEKFSFWKNIFQIVWLS